ncbi:MAG: hypothetical protein JXA71_19870 [Chitinispirillaceae bacterium]|nr:hypothetical protein [Chitinispirillaceae bacterium]
MRATAIAGLVYMMVTIFPVTVRGVDTVALQMGTIERGEGEAWGVDSVTLYNPVISSVSSFLLPGAGQIYTRHYVKAGFFPALEAIFISMVVFWHETASLYSDNARNYLALDATDSSRSDYRELSRLSSHSALDARFSQYHFTAWAIGAHVFNFFDALQASNVFRNSRERDPKTAAFLAAVPGLGLGQFYNGSLSKAGMVMMGQLSLGIMAYNSHRLMDRAAWNYARLTDPQADSLTQQLKSQYSDDWYSYRHRSFTNRNMYLWYSLFFYFYAMFDAVVDAYLHDYPDKMKIAPDLVIGKNGFSFSLTTGVRLPWAAQ